MPAETTFEQFHVNVRIKIAALWASMLFVFAFVHIFSLYRADFRADLDAGEIAGFAVDERFSVGGAGLEPSDLLLVRQRCWRECAPRRRVVPHFSS